MTEPGSDNAQRAETEQRRGAAQVSNHLVIGDATRSLAGVVLAVAVAAALPALGILMVFAGVHIPLRVVHLRGFEQREGVELVVVPLGVIAGALLWQRFGVTTAMSRNRIVGPWLPPLGVCLIIGASLLLISSWRGDYPWYGPTRLLLAAALACGAFVIGRFYPRTSAILAGALGTPALFAVAVLALPQLLVDPCERLRGPLPSVVADSSLIGGLGRNDARVDSGANPGYALRHLERLDRALPGGVWLHNGA